MMLPMVFIIITGNIDLSIASNMGMSASFMGLLHNHGGQYMGRRPWQGFCLARWAVC